MHQEPEQASTLGHTTYQRLRDMILQGRLPIGTALQEKRLATLLGVSRTPVREAITRLFSEGLVLRDSGQTPVVRRMSVDEMVEVLHVRLLLEVDAAGRAAEGGRYEGFAALREQFARFGSGTVPTPEEHFGADDALHNLLAQRSDSRLLADLIRDLRMKTRIFDTGRVPERLVPGAQEHIAIIDAVLAGDAPAAREAMRVHIENVRTSVLAHLRRLF